MFLRWRVGLACTSRRAAQAECLCYSPPVQLRTAKSGCATKNFPPLRPAVPVASVAPKPRVPRRAPGARAELIQNHCVTATPLH